jgi:drug/metabolite transporter superfamily protein YnfA
LTSSLAKWLLRIWLVLYTVALLLFLVGTFGLFGSTKDPLAGVFLVLLGLPWSKLVDLFPEPLWPWLGAASPLVTVALLYALQRYARGP